MEFHVGQQFYNENDTRTREVVNVGRLRGKGMLVTLRCIDCSVPQKDHDIEAEELEKKIKRGIFILKT